MSWLKAMEKCECFAVRILAMVLSNILTVIRKTEDDRNEKLIQPCYFYNCFRELRRLAVRGSPILGKSPMYSCTPGWHYCDEIAGKICSKEEIYVKKVTHLENFCKAVQRNIGASNWNLIFHLFGFAEALNLLQEPFQLLQVFAS